MGLRAAGAGLPDGPLTVLVRTVVVGMAVGVIVTIISVIAITPYIALQLQSVTRSYQIVANDADATATALWVAIGMAAFAILFGTRNVTANERHHGVIAAIAVEAIVKLVALLAVGIFVVYGLADGFRDIFAQAPAELILNQEEIFGPRWVALTFLAATAIVCLPRQFQVTVVENERESHLVTASWLFPLYLFLMSLFILPIAIGGLTYLPEGSNPDLFVLTLPLQEGRQDLALLAFLGGFSSATSMVIVASIAVSTMVSNHIIMPIALQFLPSQRVVSGDVRSLLLVSRRFSIVGILGLGFLYFQLSGGSDALAAIGLIAFAGVAQFLPSLLGGIFWRGATRSGALAGLSAGFFLWGYTLFLPSFGGDFILSAEVLQNGPWGLELLKPQALLGLQSDDNLIHALIWSLGANSVVFLIVSGLTNPPTLERLQSALFVDVFRSSRAGERPHLVRTSATIEDLYVLAQRILGREPARALFDDMSRQQGTPGHLPKPSDAVISRLERELSGSVGAASAHAMVGRLVGGELLGMTELIDIADETQRLIETSRQLAQKSSELERAAHQLREANQRLKDLDARKDEFLSQVSHELRTPMTSIRSFSEILLSADPVDEEERQRFISIIHDESLRLTRLLDEILEISQLEAGTLTLPVGPVNPTASGIARKSGVEVKCEALPENLLVRANEDRLRQVLINLLSNAFKYNAADKPEVRIRAKKVRGNLTIDVIDNGGGVDRAEASMVFEKFTRGSRSSRDQGAGLGLPISRAIMVTMGGDLTLEMGPANSTFFRLHLALEESAKAAE